MTHINEKQLIVYTEERGPREDAPFAAIEGWIKTMKERGATHGYTKETVKGKFWYADVPVNEIESNVFIDSDAGLVPPSDQSDQVLTASNEWKKLKDTTIVPTVEWSKKQKRDIKRLEMRVKEVEDELQRQKDGPVDAVVCSSGEIPRRYSKLPLLNEAFSFAKARRLGLSGTITVWDVALDGTRTIKID